MYYNTNNAYHQNLFGGPHGPISGMGAPGAPSAGATGGPPVDCGGPGIRAEGL